MGYAVPAAMAAKLAHPDRPALAVCGDGGFAMSIHALMTAVQEHLPIGVLVFNNGALGWVLHGMGEKAVAAGFDPFDHAAIARSIGCDGVRVESVERPARRHQGVPRRRPAVRHRRADVAGDVVPRRHPGHRPPAPRDRLLSLRRRLRSASACSYSLTLDNPCSLGTTPHLASATPQQLGDEAGDLEVLAGGHDEGRAAAPGAVMSPSAVGGGVGAGVDGDAEEAEPGGRRARERPARARRRRR